MSSSESESSTGTHLFSQFETICGCCMHYRHEAFDCDNGQPLILTDTPHPFHTIPELHDPQERPSNQTNSPTDSFHTAPNSIRRSRDNPIEIRDDKEETCTRCAQTGHVYDDCETPIKVSGECQVCKWTKQAECNHYKPTLVWLRELRRSLGQRTQRLAIQEALSPSQ